MAKDLTLEKFTPGTEISRSPRKILGFVDAVALIVGIVLGAGIFRAPSVVAANTSKTHFCRYYFAIPSLSTFKCGPTDVFSKPDGIDEHTRFRRLAF